MIQAKIKGEERSYCADCYWKTDKEYKQKKTCEDCAHFHEETCKKTNTKLTPATIGYNTYYIQAENCKHLSTDKQDFLNQAKQLEAEGKHEEAANQYEKLAMPEKAEELRKKTTTPTTPDATNAIKTLAKKGQTITYYCPHCGTPLKIGANAEKIQKTCPTCKGDLEVINLGKLIKQHTK
jgi:hypothetical protein